MKPRAAQNSLRRYAYPHSKKKQNAPGPSEHPPIRGENMSKRLGGIYITVVVFVPSSFSASGEKGGDGVVGR